MGTYSSQRDAGGGVFRVRCVVSGWPEVFVTDSSLVLTESDGRERLLGLDPTTIRIEARADLARGGLSDGEQSIRVVDDDAHRVTASLGTLPTSRAWLTAALTKTATTAEVTSTAGFPSSGVIHIHSEAIAYSGKTSTTFTGLTRGHWDTTAQRHEGPDGDRLPGSVITDRPVGLHGRYVRLYLYGRADDVTTVGTLKWQGSARTDRSYQGGVWEWAASGIASRLDQSVGHDLEESMGISGVYLPASGGLTLFLRRWDSAELGGTSATAETAEVRMSGRWFDNDAFVDDLNTAITTATSGWGWGASAQIQASRLDQSVGHDLEEPMGISGVYLPASGGLTLFLRRWDSAELGGTSATAETAEVRMSGRWFDNDAFVDDLNTAITTATSGWGWGASAQIQAESLGPTGWRLIYRTDGTTAHYVDVSGAGASGVTRDDGSTAFDLASPVDRIETIISGVGGWRDQTGVIVDEVDAGGLYSCEFSAPVPRAAVGDHGLGFRDAANPGNTGDRIYLGGRVGLSADMWAILRPDGEEGEEEAFAAVDSVNVSERYVVVPGLEPAALGPSTRVKLARELATNQNVGGLITLIFANSPNLVNSGAMPLITGQDFDFDFDAVTEAAADLSMSRRTWVSQEGITLREIIEHELRLLGCYLSVRQNGALTVRRLRAPTPTDASSLTITPRNASGGAPGLTFAPYGTIKQLLIRQGWSWTEGEHKGLTIKVTNVETIDASVLAGDLEIAPRSRAVVTGEFGLEVDIEQAYSLGSTVLGLFGGAYQIATFEVAMGTGEGTEALFDAEIGETVVVTSPYLPSPDGTMGTTIRPGVLVGYSWSPMEGKGEFEVLFVGLNVAGYAPEFPILGETDNGGDEWTLALSWADYVPGASAPSDWLTAGDEVQAVPLGLSGTSTTTVADETGNASDVTIVSQDYTDGPGGYQGAIWFDGSGGGQTTGAGTAAQWAALTSDCTITMWVRPDKLEATQRIASFYGGPTDIEADNILAAPSLDSSGHPRLFFEHGAGTNVTLTATTAVGVGVWSRIDWVRDSSAGTVKCFINGALVDTFTSQPDATGGTTSRAIAIATSNTGTAPFWGAIYGLTLRDVAKSDASIAAERVLSEPDGDTVGMWMREQPVPVTGDVVSVSGGNVTVQFDATVALGSGSWLLAYQPSSGVDETANGSKRWTQANFAFVADAVRRLTFASGDVDALEFAP